MIVQVHAHTVLLRAGRLGQSAHQLLEVLRLLLVIVQLSQRGGTVLVHPETHSPALVVESAR